MAVSKAQAEEIVRKAYKEILGRDPDPQGLAFWVDLMLKGWSESKIRRHIQASPEGEAMFVKQHYGEGLASFLTHAELGPILKKAAKEGWDALRLQGAIQNTKWWKTTPDTARKWEILNQLDPATANQQKEQMAASIQDLAQSLGISLNPTKLNQLVDQALKGGWTQAQLEDAVRTGATPADLQAIAIDAYGAYGWLLNEDQEVKDLLLTAAKEGWSPQRVDREVRGTEWFKTTSPSERDYLTLAASDPAGLQQQLDGLIEEIGAQATSLGLNLSPEDVAELASQSLIQGFSPDRLFREMVALAPEGSLEALMRAQFGAMGQLMAIPELQDLLVQAASEQWNPALLQTELEKTQWWQGHSEAARAWQTLEASDPGEAQRRREAQKASIANDAEQLGIEMSDEELNALAQLSLQFGWSDVELQDAILAEFEFKTGLPGEAGAIQQLLKDTANNYLVDISQDDMSDWIRQILDGSQNASTFQAFIREQSKSRRPWLSDVIDQGLTVRQFADVYAQDAANELGINPATVNFSDPKWSAPIDFVDPTTGNRRAMSRDEWVRTIRTKPQYGYDFTQKAQTEAAQLETELLQKFGAVG